MQEVKADVFPQASDLILHLSPTHFPFIPQLVMDTCIR